MGFLKNLLSLMSLRWLKRVMPKSLYVRTILIIIIPTFLALTVATYVFFDRHWSTTTNRLSHAIAGDIGAILEATKFDHDVDTLRTMGRKMDLTIYFTPDKKLKRPIKEGWSPLQAILREALNERVSFPYRINMQRAPAVVIIQVEHPDGLYAFHVPQRRIYTPTTEVFIAWMIGSSILLSAIALLFMRNQVRPVRRLADAAEAIGKGQDVPWFKPEGATEVRQAAMALMVMRDRIRRAMTQRTTMLAGVSHDLRTPLTRMKLQLAMMQENAQTRGFKSDIEEMETMLEAYLAFARGDEAEASVEFDLGTLLGEIVETAKRQHENVTLSIEDNVTILARPNALRRCINNLIGNALRYGKNAHLSMQVRDRAIDIIVDDDGPGIPSEKREEVFRPFFRLDASRNMETGGVGLGLTIARDIARNHGGNLVLEESPSGGLRARVWLPT